MGKENTTVGMVALKTALENSQSFFIPQEVMTLSASDVGLLSQSMEVNFGTTMNPVFVKTSLGASLVTAGVEIVIPVVNVGPVSLMYVDPRREEFIAMGADLGRLAAGLLPDAVGRFTSKKSMFVCEAATKQAEVELGKKLGRVTFINDKDLQIIKAAAAGRPIVVYMPITAQPGEVKYLTTSAEDAAELAGDGRLVQIDDVNSSGASKMAARIYRAIIRGNSIPTQILADLAEGKVLSETAMQAIEAGIDPTGKEEAELTKMTLLARRIKLLEKFGTNADIIGELAGNKQAYVAAVIAQAGIIELGNDDLEKLALTVAEIEMAIPEVREVCLAQEYQLIDGLVPDLPKSEKALFRIPVIVNS